jgi:hypothetical protein
MSDLNSSLPIRTETAGDVKIIIVDSSNPSLGATVDAFGNLKTSATFSGSLSADQGTPNSLASAWPVEITDGTNILGTTANPVKVDPTGTTTQPVSVSGSVTVAQPTGTNLHVVVDSSALVNVQGNVTVVQPTGTNLHTVLDSGTLTSITNPVAATQSGSWTVAVKDSSGNAITTSNPLPVFISATLPGTEINHFNTAAGVAANASSNHDYTITVSKTFIGKKFWASASGKMKVEVQISPDGSTFNTKWVGFNSAANPNVPIDLDAFSVSDSGTGSKIRIIRTNLDKAAQDVYSTISGTES